MLFQQVTGQEELKRMLIQEVNEEKVSHAQLFLGKNGYGSLAITLAFVQYLFCENKQSQDSCGTCPSCIKVKNLQHPDLHFTFPTVLADNKTSEPLLGAWRQQIAETPYFDLNHWLEKIDPKGRKPSIGVDHSQEILRKLSLKAFEGKYKVMIIWMAEEMNIQCSNKLLKILEEPPQNTIFLLVSESVDRMLPTILSRTQILKIPRIDSDSMSLYLRETLNVSPVNLQSVLVRAEGDRIEAKGLALSQEETINTRDIFIQMMRVCYKKNVIDMMDWAEQVSAEGKESQKQFLEYSLHMFRQSLLKNYTQDTLTRVSPEENSFLENFAKYITGNNVFDFMNSFNDAHYHLERNANSKILFTNLCFNVMRYIHKA
jgi:DNA polymerase-3 subunit delta'